MKILQVSDYFPDYGARIVDTISRKLSSAGHEVLVVAGTVNQLGKYYDRGTTILDRRLSLLRFSAFGVRGAGTSFSIPLPNLPLVLETIRKFRPDIANLHFVPHLGNFVLAPFLKIGGIPTVFTVHGVPTGYSTLALRGSSELVNWIARVPIAMADHVIAVSDEVLRLARKKYEIENDRISVVSNGINVERFRPIYENVSSPALRVGYCGRLSAPKNVQTIIRAIYLVRKELGLSVSGVIAGAGPALHELQRLASGLSVPVEFKGHIEADCLASFYHEVDLLAHVSAVEGLPQSILEAMSSGVPVITRLTGGITDVIENGSNGIVLDSGSAEELADAIVRLAKDSGLRKRICENARSTILEYHSDTVMCDNYLRIYQEIIERS